MPQLKASFKLNDETQSVQELWQSIDNMASNRIRSMSCESNYPLATRKRQVQSLRILVETLEKSHTEMEKQ